MDMLVVHANVHWVFIQYYCCNICPFHIVIFSSNYHECVIMLFFFLNLFISMDILFFQQLT